MSASPSGSNDGSNMPAWLTAAIAPSRLNSALRTLAKREAIRMRARAQSRTTSRLLQSQSLSSESLLAHYSTSVSSLPENELCNRYLDICPYDRTRVVLGRDATRGGGGGG